MPRFLLFSAILLFCSVCFGLEVPYNRNDANQINIDFANTIRGLGNTALKAAKARKATTFVTAVQNTNVKAFLHTDQPMTILVPTDDAFKALNTPDLTVNAGFRRRLEQVLKYHVIAGRFTAAQLGAAGQPFATLEGSSITFSTDATGVSATDTNQRKAKLVQTDIAFFGGLIHLIDNPLLPLPSCAEIVRTRANLKTFYRALETLEMVDQLAGFGSPVTVFAPTDAAFAGTLPVGMNVNKLLENVVTASRYLNYHVIAGAQPSTSAAFTQNAQLTNLIGTPLKFTGNPGAAPPVFTLLDNYGNTANIVERDIACSNGVVHVVDRVLVPA